MNQLQRVSSGEFATSDGVFTARWHRVRVTPGVTVTRYAVEMHISDRSIRLSDPWDTSHWCPQTPEECDTLVSDYITRIVSFTEGHVSTKKHAEDVSRLMANH
jgi:hypothetical protein